MKKWVIAFLIGNVMTVLFAVLAGLGGGACHCSTPLQVLFPYVSLLGIHADPGILGNLLFWLQCPLYAVTVVMPKRGEWRVAVLFLLLALHGGAVAVAFRISG